MWHFIVLIFSSHPSDVALFLSFWIQNLTVMHLLMNMNIYIFMTCVLFYAVAVVCWPVDLLLLLLQHYLPD